MLKPLLLGALLATLCCAAAWHLLRDDAAAAAPCDDRCGPGTTCDGALCVVAIEPDAEPTPTPSGRKSKRRSRRKAGAPAAEADDHDLSEAPGADRGPPIVDDRAVPRYSEAASKTLDLNAGGERLSAAALDAELRRLTPRFQSCLRDAVARGAELGSGTITIQATIAGSGRVEGVSARAPRELDAPGVVACIRVAVHQHRFPAFDGPSFNSTLRFDVD